MQRVSTWMQFAAGEQAISARQRELLDAQRRVASGQRIATPSDDPIGSAAAATLRSGLSQLEQFRSNQSHARFLLSQSENVVAQFSEAVVDARDRLLAAANDSYGDGERLMMARELESVLARMVALANTTDGLGGFLFAGTREGAAPFAQSGTDVAYVGDGNEKRLEVAGRRLMKTSFTGEDVFLRIRAGNGSFTTAAADSNSGSGRIGAGGVTDPSALTGSDYAIEYDGAQYVVTRLADSVQFTFPPGSGGTTLQFDGVQVRISGAPAAGDQFEVRPAGLQSIFDTMAQAIAALQLPAANAAERARVATLVGGAIASIDGAYDHLLLKRAEIGASLAELDGLGQLREVRDLDLQGRLSDVADVDYAEAITHLTRRQTAFEAAIKSYSTVSRLSLFDYL